MVDFNVGDTVGINPSLYKSEAKKENEFADGFAALVEVVGSRYAKLEYGADSGFAPKLAIKWTLISTGGKPFEKMYSTGIEYDANIVAPSPDGSRLIVTDAAKFTGLRPNSDGVHLIQKAISSGFDENLLADSIAVFEGHCFFVTTDRNPNSKGSSPKAYPKQYHPEGFKAALAAREAKKGAAAQMTGSYAPPAVVQAPAVAGETIALAGTVLTEILSNTGGKVAHTQIPAKIGELAPSKGWSTKQRQDVTLALWDKTTLSTVIAEFPFMAFDGDTISMK